MRVAGPWLYNRPVKKLLQWLVNLSVKGPDEEKRRRASAVFIGEATNQSGGRVVTKLTTPEGYTCTALTTVEIMRRILDGDLKIGFQTPSMAYGANFITQFKGVKRENLI